MPTVTVGIGRAIAVALFAGGAETYALSRTQEDLDKLEAEVMSLLLLVVTQQVRDVIVSRAMFGTMFVIAGCIIYAMNAHISLNVRKH